MFLTSEELDGQCLCVGEFLSSRVGWKGQLTASSATGLYKGSREAGRAGPGRIESEEQRSGVSVSSALAHPPGGWTNRQTGGAGDHGMTLSALKPWQAAGYIQVSESLRPTATGRLDEF